MSLPMDWLNQMKEMERLKIQNRLLEEENKKLREQIKALEDIQEEELDQSLREWNSQMYGDY